MSLPPLVRRHLTSVLTIVACLIAFTTVFAQRRFGGMPAAAKPFASNGKYDGRFRFARIKYDCFGNCFYYQGMPSWEHGYPLAEQNLMLIMDSMSSLHPHVEDSEVLTFEDPDLLKYPVAYMVEGSFWLTTDTEAKAVGAYLKKGGFLIADDFRNDYNRGSGGWANFDANIQRAIPGAEFVELTPEHPIFHSFYEINSFSVIPQYYDRNRPVLMGLYEDNDPHKRLLVIANFNTDISEFWEFSGQGYRPIADTNEAYKLGVNYLVYGLTR